MTTTPDRLAHVKPGDPDPCDWFYPGRGFCGETAGEALGNACMREHGHPGQHIDSNGVEVLATWSQKTQ